MSPDSANFEAHNCAEKQLLSWHDSGGYTCADYEAKEWCDAGTVGPHWNTGRWGSFASYSGTAGVDASMACCGCIGPQLSQFYIDSGCSTSTRTGDSVLINNVASLDVAHLRRTLKCCADDTTWTDSDGEPCSSYVSEAYCEGGNVGSGWDNDWGSISDYADDGFDAYQKCCACGAPDNSNDCSSGTNTDTGTNTSSAQISGK